MDNTHVFTRGEEIANAISHAVGVVFSLSALVLLIVFAAVHGNSWHIVTFAIFGFTMLLLYTCSTLLHALPHGRAKDVFEILDHSSIYLFIAGTYTPILLLLVKGWVAWTLFSVLWGIAAAPKCSKKLDRITTCSYTKDSLTLLYSIQLLRSKPPFS